MPEPPAPSLGASGSSLLRRDRNILLALGLLVGAVTLILGVGLFAHIRGLGVPATGTLGFGARLVEAAPRFGQALALVALWVCAVLAATAASLALLGRPWRITLHFGAAAAFASLSFAVAGLLAYAAAS